VLPDLNKWMDGWMEFSCSQQTAISLKHGMDFILILCSFTAIVSVVNDVYVDLTTVET